MLNILEEIRTSVCIVLMSCNEIFEWRMIGSFHIILTDHCWFIKAHEVGYVRELDVVVYMYAGGRWCIWENSLGREGRVGRCKRLPSFKNSMASYSSPVRERVMLAR